MLQHVTPQQVRHIIAMCEEHVSKLSQDPESETADLWTRDGGPLSPAAEAVKRFHDVLSSQIAGLSPDAQIEILALMIVGRYPGDYRSFWDAVKDARSEFDSQTPDYLADKQLVLGKYLASGLQVIQAKAA